MFTEGVFTGGLPFTKQTPARAHRPFDVDPQTGLQIEDEAANKPGPKGRGSPARPVTAQSSPLPQTRRPGAALGPDGTSLCPPHQVAKPTPGQTFMLLNVAVSPQNPQQGRGRVPSQQN